MSFDEIWYPGLFMKMSAKVSRDFYPLSANRTYEACHCFFLKLENQWKLLLCAPKAWSWSMMVTSKTCSRRLMRSKDNQIYANTCAQDNIYNQFSKIGKHEQLLPSAFMLSRHQILYATVHLQISLWVPQNWVHSTSKCLRKNKKLTRRSWFRDRAGSVRVHDFQT